jgi:PII-like signaling protein
MSHSQRARLLRIHICEGDKYQQRSLYEAIIERCQEFGLAGATVFRGLEGYGETAEIHRKHLLARDQPIIVVIVDSEENIARALPAFEEMVDTGMIAASDVEMRRIQNGKELSDTR